MINKLGFMKRKKGVQWEIQMESRWGDEITSGINSDPLPFLMMDRLADKVRQESPWTMMIADDIAE